jgi:hypothetical protein
MDNGGLHEQFVSLQHFYKKSKLFHVGTIDIFSETFRILILHRRDIS